MPSAIRAAGDPACASSSIVLSTTGLRPRPVKRQTTPKPIPSISGLRARSASTGRSTASGEPVRLRLTSSICKMPQSQSSGVFTDRISDIGPAASLPSAESTSGMPSITMLP